jgi:hypothetical protein
MLCILYYFSSFRVILGRHCGMYLCDRLLTDRHIVPTIPRDKYYILEPRVVMVVVLHVDGMDARNFTMSYYDETTNIDSHLHVDVLRVRTNPIPPEHYHYQLQLQQQQQQQQQMLTVRGMDDPLRVTEQVSWCGGANKSFGVAHDADLLLWSWSSYAIYSILFFYLTNYQYKDGLSFCIFTCECYNYCIRSFVEKANC